MPKISVIVPIYKVEKYIGRCARSLFEQSLEDMEFIFVDDCSPDNSISIVKTMAEDYPKRKNQIKFLHHKVNRGLTTTRNTGLSVATGDYIAYCDSDDWFDLTMYENYIIVLLKRMQTYVSVIFNLLLKKNFRIMNLHQYM